MEAERDSMIFYKSFVDSILVIDDITTKEKVFEAIAIYGIYGEEIELDGVAKALFVAFKAQIDANNKRYIDGCKGGRPKKTTGFETEKPLVSENEKTEKPLVSENEETQKPNDNVNDNDNDNENDNVNEERKGRTSAPRFRKPTREEVAEYCQERGNHVDVDRWFDYYESNGWKVGKNPMKDWKAAIRTWEKNGYDNPRGKPNTYGGSTERANAFDDLEEQLMNELNGGL